VIIPIGRWNRRALGHHEGARPRGARFTEPLMAALRREWRLSGCRQRANQVGTSGRANDRGGCPGFLITRKAGRGAARRRHSIRGARDPRGAAAGGGRLRRRLG
jgi:hypothetical protein